LNHHITLHILDIVLPKIRQGLIFKI
jgi:hypothetical protein